jgi:ABC-type lipoprotein release transport system permease subunit
MPGQANVLEVRLDTTRDTESATTAIRAAAGEAYSVSDWRSMNGGLFSALAIQQTTLFLVIGLIVGVSTFNIIATLVMTVQEKKRDIGVLTTLGAERGFVARVFLSLGGLLGGAGVVAGVLFGVVVCWVMTRFRLLSFDPGVAEIYFVSYIPFLVRGVDLAAIVGGSAVAILLASLLPAWLASRIDIADALRYE